MANDICYIEFHGGDVKGKSKFFKDVFGWNSQPMVGEGSDYAMWNSGENELSGGFGGGEAKTIAYISVADIDATLEAINENGDKTVVPKTQISPDYGCFAHFTDCCGTILGLWSKS